MWWDGVDDDAFPPSGLGVIDLTYGGQFDRSVLNSHGQQLARRHHAHADLAVELLQFSVE